MKPESLLGKLIEIKSYSGQEAAIRDFIQQWFKERGLEAFRQGDNLVVHLEGKDRTRAFAFNSHMDTVMANAEMWNSNPWQPTMVGDRLVGLGASDMKSGVAASMATADRIAQQGIPQVDLWFTYVVKEEEDGSGTAEFADWFDQSGYAQQYRESAAIFTEPTGLADIEYGHRGNIFLGAETYGDSGHASRPSAIKTHAVRNMIAFADALQQAFQNWQREFNSDVFDPPTVGELTSIQAGLTIAGETNPTIEVGSPNKFPEVCRASFDVRTIPGFHEVAIARITELAQNYGVVLTELFRPCPSGYTDPNDRLVKVAQSVMNTQTLLVSQASADLGFFTAKGIKSIIIGPGERDQCHLPNEFCYPYQVSQAINVYTSIIEGWANTK